MKKDVNYYQKFVRPKVNSNSIRIDDELYKLNEIIRVFYATDYITPNNADIMRILLKRHVNELREKDNPTIMQIELAIEKALEEHKKDK